MIKLVNDDCFLAMNDIECESVDFIFTDPPYGMTTRNKWDVDIPLDKMWEQFNRIIKPNGCIAIFGLPPFSFNVAMANKKFFRYEWICEKTQPVGYLNANKMPMRTHENLLIFYKHLPTYNPQKTTGHNRKVSLAKHKAGSRESTNYGHHKFEDYDSTERFPRDVITFNWGGDHSEIYHPTQKPLEACEYFIKTYTNEGMVVLDPFMGSGTTGLACKNLNRDFIGIEINKEYFDVANNRINNYEI